MNRKRATRSTHRRALEGWPNGDGTTRGGFWEPAIVADDDDGERARDAASEDRIRVLRNHERP